MAAYNQTTQPVDPVTGMPPVTAGTDPNAGAVDPNAGMPPTDPWADNADAQAWFLTPEGQQWQAGRDPNTGGYMGARTTDFQDSNGNGVDDRDEPWMHQQQGMPPADPAADPNAGMPPSNYSPWSTSNQGGGGSYAGQATVGANASPADYQGVQDFSDAAYDNARRYLDPQQAFDNRRFDQELINRGIDPMSDYGRQMSEQMAREHGDQDQGAAYGAMQFGQGIQEQMFRQNFDNTRQAGDMQKSSWANDLGWGNLELGRQNQDFNEMLGYDAIDYRNNSFNEMNNRWDQTLAMQMAGYPMSAGGTTLPAAGTSPLTPWSSFYNNELNRWEYGG